MLSSNKFSDYIIIDSLKKPELFFRFMREEDLDIILRIERASFSAPWSKFYFIHELHVNKNAFLLIMLHQVRYEEIILGYTDLWKEKNILHMANFAIEPRYRNKGYGASFLQFCMYFGDRLSIETIKLEVRVSNDSAIRLYKKAGFQITSLLKRYYIDNNEDGYLMVAEVKNSIKLL